MKIVFFGLGSIGTRHARLLKAEYGHELFAFRSGISQKSNQLGIPEIRTWREIEKIKPDVAFITNPTSLHINTALYCARRGINLFIEKPLGSQTRNLKGLLNEVSKRKLSTYVAYLLRFHPVVIELKKYAQKHKLFHMRVQTTSYLHRWRPGSDPLKSYSARLEMGGGVIYDLSHELDYVQYILGDIQKINGRFSRRSHLTVDTEDYADILVETKKSPANIHIDYLSQIEQRTIQMDFKDKSIIGDLIKNTVSEYRNGRRVKIKKMKGGIKECYREQLRYYFKNIKNKKMMNNVFQAVDLFKKIYQFKKRGA